DSETGNIKSFQDGMLVSDITDEKFKDYKKYIRYVLGGGFNKEYLSAELAEIMVCREVIDDTSRQQVEKYLNEKFGIYTPQMSIPNIGLNLWLKADSGVIQNDAMVSTWEDQSGNGNNVAQNVAEKQPVLVANALRGKPAVRFDGEDDELLKKLSKAYSGSSTIALVMKQTTSGQGENRGFLSTGDKSVVNSFEIAGDKNGTGVLEARNSNGSSTAISDSKTEEYVKLVVTIDAHKGSIKAYQDGKLISDKTDTSYKSFNEVAGYILGKGQDNRHLSVEIAELMFYRKVLSGEDRKMIEEYLNEKYSGEVTPVSTKDLDLWLRADKGVRMNGEFVSQWADQSGHYNDVIQDDAELQPKLVNDGINGKAVVRFDGKDDFLLKELSKEYKGSSTIIMVMKQNMLGQGQNKGVFGTNTWKPNDEPGAFSITGGWAGDGVMTLVDSSAQSNVLSVTDARSGSYFVVSIKANSDTGNVKAYKNGVLISEKTSDAFKNFNTFTKYYLGRGYWANFLSCDLAEMLIYRRAIEDIEIQQAEQYLNDKYKIYNPIAVDGLDLWLKADTGLTLDGTKVSKWSDQSGSGNDVEQSEKNRQPEIIKDAVNGKSVIRFDGLDDELLKELEKPHVGSSSILIVLKQRIDQGGSKGIFATDTVGSEGAYGIASHKENKGMLAAQAANNGIVQISDNKTLSYRVLSITADPKKGSFKAYENGKLTASVTDDNIKGFNKISKYVLGRIFDGGNLSADIAEIIVYNRAINDDERKLAEKYLNSRYLIYIPEPDISKEKQELGIPTAAMNLWVRADYGVKTKGNAVERWEDLSGNGNDLVQPDKKMQPILVEGAINEKQAVRFDGIDDELSKVLNGTYTGNSSIFMVLKQTADVNKGRSIFATSSKGQKGAVEIGYGSESGALAVFNSENQKVLVRAGDKGRESYMTLGTFIETNTGNISIYENGSLISSKTEDNLKQCNTFEKYILGKGAYGKNAGAEIAELMVFRRVLTNSERMQVENYFNKKYSVYTQPPELKADNDIKAAVAKAPVPEGYLSIADYGAKADDSGDDLEAINKCINDAAKNKKGVYIPEGTFEYSDLFTLDGLNMIGAGKDKSFLHSTSLDRQAVKLTGTNAGISGCRLTTVKPKQRLMNEQSARIYVLGASNFTISDVFIDGGS
ncbi:MAG: hypothetical protein K0R84_2845, partial [Clostridia bacterium]|nr:hypothetical protein [Clostridia bacterium]